MDDRLAHLNVERRRIVLSMKEGRRERRHDCLRGLFWGVAFCAACWVLIFWLA